MTDTRREPIPTDGFGLQVSDTRFLLDCLAYMFEATGETMDPEDMAAIERIRADHHLARRHSQ